MLHKGDIGAEKWSVQSVKYDEKYLNKTAYNVVTKYYNYDGKLVRTKNTPVTVKEYAEKTEEAEEKAGDYNNYDESSNYNEENSSSSSPAV